MALYTIAVKRHMRTVAPSDWVDRLVRIEHLEVLGSHGDRRVVFEAGEEALDQAKNIFGQYCYIEPVIEHNALGS